MTWIEKRPQLAFGIAFAILLVALITLGHVALAPKADSDVVNPLGAYAAVDPDCRVVDDLNMAYRHAYAEGWYQSLREWEHRPKAYKPIPAEGVTVPISTVWFDRVTQRDVTIKTQADYESYRNGAIRDFIRHSANAVLLPDGRSITAYTSDGGNSAIQIQTGANVKHWYYVGDEPTHDAMHCFYLPGGGIPPTPTPTPVPVDDPDDSESEGG